MTGSRRLGAAVTLAAVVLPPVPAVPQEHAATEREAFASVARAGAAVARAGDTDSLSRAVEQAVAAARRARGAFDAADRASAAAESGYRAAYREARAGAVTCENDYPCTNGRVDPFDGVTAALAAHFELLAAVSAANAVYVNAVGLRAADEARARAVRIRRFAARMRDLETRDESGRWNALVGSVGIEVDAGNVLHRRATEARQAANRAHVDDLTGVIDSLYRAAIRIADESWPGSGDPAGAGGADSAHVARAEAGDNGSAAELRAAIDDARGVFESLRTHIVAPAPSVPEVLPSVSERAAVAGNDMPVAGTAAVEPGAADDVEEWVRTLTAATRAAEQAAVEAEAAASGSGSWFSRASSCIDAEARATAAATLVTSLTVGDDRPDSIPVRAGHEAYSELVVLMDAASERARTACSAIRQPR